MGIRRELNQVESLLHSFSNFEAFIAEIGNGWLMLVYSSECGSDMGKITSAAPKYGIKFLN